MKIVTILGTRPEIIKLSALLPLLDEHFHHLLIHTGQHYDYQMDKVFFEELQLREPDFRLNVGSHTPGKQMARILEKTEEILLKEKPGLVVVVGDTNSTFAGALAAAKLFIPLMHVESGCRSFNREVPEELNKTIVPHIADYCIVPDTACRKNLEAMGIDAAKMFLVGSTIFDAVERGKTLMNQEKVLQHHGLKKDDFVLLTLHRAENTDNSQRLRGMLQAMNRIAEHKTIVFSIHPRTRKIIALEGIRLHEKIKVIEPESYLNFLALLSACRFCLSDSGGIQEEALVFNVPCLILRNETEWTRLVDAGKNILLGTEPEKIVSIATGLLQDERRLQEIKQKEFPYDIGVSRKILEVIKRDVIKMEETKNIRDGS